MSKKTWKSSKKQVTLFMLLAFCFTSLLYPFSSGQESNHLIADLKFEEGQGSTAFDNSGHHNDGQLFGDFDWVGGKSGGALSFNGIDSYLQLPDELIYNTYPITISLWFKTLSSGGILGYQSQEYPNISFFGWSPAIYVGLDGKLRGEFWSGPLSPIPSAITVNDGKWH